MAPPGECLPTTEIFRRLARRMGLDAPALYDSDEDDGAPAPRQRAPVAGRHHARGAEGARLDAARLSRSVRAVRDRLPDAVRQARVRLRSRWRRPGSTRSPATRRPTRRRSATRRWPREYPLALVTPADHYFLNSIFANVPAPAAALGRRRRSLIHPDDAAPRRHRDGRRGARRQRARRVPRRGRRERSRPPGRGRQHQGPLAGLTRRTARPSTPPSTSATRTWAAAPSFTTTASRSSASSLERVGQRCRSGSTWSSA